MKFEETAPGVVGLAEHQALTIVGNMNLHAIDANQNSMHKGEVIAFAILFDEFRPRPKPRGMALDAPRRRESW